MDPSLPQIFVIGATGYIGGDILYELANGEETRKLLNPSKYKLVLLSRTEEKRDLMTQEYGSKFPHLEVVLGDFDSLDLLEELANKSNIVLNVSYSDDLPSVEALVRGIRKGNGVLLHTSGAGALTDWAKGEFGPQKIYSDQVQESIRCDDKSSSRAHGIVDVKLQDTPNSIIFMPPEVYGLGRGLIKRVTTQLALSIQVSQKLGYAPCMGQGLNKWSNIHVQDLTNAYVFILGKLLSQKDQVKNFEGYLFVENGNEPGTLKEFLNILCEVLYEKGVLKSSEPQQAPPQIVALDRKGMVGGNVMIKADRLQKLGWTPSAKFPPRLHKPTIEREVDEALEDPSSTRSRLVWNEKDGHFKHSN